MNAFSKSQIKNICHRAGFYAKRDLSLKIASPLCNLNVSAKVHDVAGRQFRRYRFKLPATFFRCINIACKVLSINW